MVVEGGTEKIKKLILYQILAASNTFATCYPGLRQDEEPGERDGVHLAQGEVPEPTLPYEGDVQQLRGRGGRLGLARGRFESHFCPSLTGDS